MSFFLPPLIGPARNVRVRFDVFAAGERWEQRRGARVPWDVYRGDRRWIPPLRAQWSRALDPARNPLLAQTEHALFLAEARNLSLGDVVAGRLVVWAGQEDGIGYFGAFEAINDPDLTEALFAAAEGWLFEHVWGLEMVRGPASLDPLSASGLLVDGFAARPAAFLPYNPPYYPELFTREGFEHRGRWQAYAFDLTRATAPRPERQPAWDIRVLGREDWADLAGAILDLYHHAEDGLGAWQTALKITAEDAEGAENLKASAISAPSAVRFSSTVVTRPAWASVLNLLAGGTDPCFSLEARLALRWLRPRTVLALAWEAGEPVGVVVGLPDNSIALRRANGRLLPLGWMPYLLAVRGTRRLRVLPAAVKAARQGQGLEQALYAAVAEAAVARGFEEAIVGPLESEGITTNAQAMNALGARAVQTYQMCEKDY